MSHVVEEIEEIKRIARLNRSRKPRTVYYIHATIRTKNGPSPPFSQETEKAPACIIDLSSTVDDQQSFFGVSRRHSSPSSPPPKPSHHKTQEEQPHPRPPVWENDPVALHALSLLGLDERATPTDIKKRWRKLAQKLHPDKGGNAETFIRIRTAYETLITRSRSKAP
ncbi:MAG: J domain-containing protein [Candidatus Latescibacteria bacterium]|nr:J domain-containing protein [Candidatus Latescibacterota bacterium]